MYPFFEGQLLANVNNRAMKEFVEHISKLAPATIRCYADIVKAVVASAIDEHGEQLFPRTWNEEFIDAPLIKNQKQPTTDIQGMESILAEASKELRCLYAILAGCGPLRVGEALGLPIENVSRDGRTLVINQKAKRGKIQTHLKTENGEREVDLCESLAALLREQIGSRTSGLVFCEEDGSQIMQRDILKYSLHPILKKLKLEQGGFNSTKTENRSLLDFFCNSVTALSRVHPISGATDERRER